jgi:hypothetical protein
MNITHEIHGDLPPMTLSTEELTELLISLFVANPGNYSFTSCLNAISSYLIKIGTGFNAAANTTYYGGLCQSDQTKVREIVWDMIIDRHLTIGGAGHHD